MRPASLVSNLLYFSNGLINMCRCNRVQAYLGRKAHVLSMHKYREEKKGYINDGIMESKIVQDDCMYGLNGLSCNACMVS